MNIHMIPCPCNPQAHYEHCCAPFHKHLKTPETPEALMRSRYSAYSLNDMDYIEASMTGKALEGFDKRAAEQENKSVQWIGLKIIQTGHTHAEQGQVEFIAYYFVNQHLKSIHESSEFHLIKSQWFYVDGEIKSDKSGKIARNHPCPCGSLRKFKNCHGSKALPESF